LHAWFTRSWHIVLGVALVLLLLRMVAPFGIRSMVNKRLKDVPEYAGQVADVDLHIWRGGYTLQKLEIFKTTGDTREPYFSADEIDFSLAWRELFRGRVVSDIDVEKGSLTIVNGPTEESSQKDADKRWQAVIEDLFPIEITRFELSDSTIRFIDRDAKPEVDLVLTDLGMVAKGLQNRPSEKRGPMPASVELQARTIGDGELTLFGEGNLLAEQPLFKLNLELKGVHLPALNPFLQAYGNVDVSSGNFELFLEVAAAEGRYEGYVKPFFEDLVFKGVEDENKPIMKRLWERLVAGMATLVKNKKKDEVATRVPFSGEFGATDVGILATIGNLFRHGFGRALTERLEGSIFPPKEGGWLKPDDPKKQKEEARSEGADGGAEREAKGGRAGESAPVRPQGKP